MITSTDIAILKAKAKAYEIMNAKAQTSWVSPQEHDSLPETWVYHGKDSKIWCSNDHSVYVLNHSLELNPIEGYTISGIVVEDGAVFAVFLRNIDTKKVECRALGMHKGVTATALVRGVAVLDFNRGY